MNKALIKVELGLFISSIIIVTSTVLAAEIDIHKSTSEYLQSGQQISEQEKYSETIDFSQAVISSYSATTSEYVNLTKEYFRREQYNAVINLISSATETFKDNLPVELIFYYGTAYYRIEDYLNATKWLSYAVEKDSANVLANFNLGLSYYKSEQYQQAIPYLKKAGELDPDLSSRAYYLIGLSYYKLNNRPESISWLRKLVQEFPYSRYTTTGEQLLIQLGVSIKELRREPAISVYKPWLLKLDLTGGYDNNIDYQNSTREGVTGVGDNQYTLNFTGKYYFRNIANLGYNYYQAVYPRNRSYDYIQHTANLVWYPFYKPDLNLNLSYNYTYAVWNTNPYYGSNSLDAGVWLTETEILSGMISYNYTQTNYLDVANQYLNGRTYALHLSQYLKVTSRGYLSVSYSLRDADTKNLAGEEPNYYYYPTTYTWQWVYTPYFRSYSYRSDNININLKFNIIRKLSLMVLANRESRTYKQQDKWYTKPVTNIWSKSNDLWYEYVDGIWVIRGIDGPPPPRLMQKTRKDVRDTLGITLEYEINNLFSVFTYYSFTRNSSNITATDYDDKNYQKYIWYTGINFRL